MNNLPEMLNIIFAKDGFELFDKLSNKFFLRLVVDLISVFALIRFIYFRNYKKSDQFLTFFVFNLIIFLISYLMNKVEMTMGAAFGLFAVFSMLRFRTEGIQTKDMTYLFLVIAIGLISAISKGNWDELILLNSFIFIATYILESNFLIKREDYKVIYYDNLENLKPENKSLLLVDIQERTGIVTHRVEIIRIDFLKDSAIIHAFYYLNQ